ncbi:MAG: DUF4392 domain-containing protein [Candidatus Accumulibacter sp.]|nr:DUF4392 domain-containing protein [Accumulibacter sp.]
MTCDLSVAAIEAIGQITRSDPSGRGLAQAVPEIPLREAAAELLSGQRVALVTGFCIRSAMTGESDGPPGTLTLAAALSRLGKEIALITDTHSAELLAAVSAVHQTSFPVTTLTLSGADTQLTALAASFSPTHVVAIERPGKAKDGHLYSMRGEMLDDIVPAADILFQPSAPRRWKTIAIGDGGNELGMGSLREGMKQRVSHGDLIFCATPADFVIAAGTSNWGSYALTAALSLLSGTLLLPSPQKERNALEALLAAGAVDGCTKSPSLSVDGIPWDDYSKILEAIYRETQKALPACTRPGT